MPVAVFTARSTGLAVAIGVLVPVTFALLFGVPWGLAILTGLPAGALALTFSLWEEPFDTLGAKEPRRRRAVRILALTVLFGPAVFLDDVIELKRGSEFALGALVLLTAFAAYVLGAVMATLDRPDDHDTADPRLHLVTPPPGAASPDPAAGRRT